MRIRSLLLVCLVLLVLLVCPSVFAGQTTFLEPMSGKLLTLPKDIDADTIDVGSEADPTGTLTVNGQAVALTVPAKWNFVNDTARDTYFTTTAPEELVSGIWIVSNSIFQHYETDTWVSYQSIQQGPVGVITAANLVTVIGAAADATLARTAICSVVIDGVLYKTTLADVLGLLEAGDIPDLAAVYLTQAAADLLYAAIGHDHSGVYQPVLAEGAFIDGDKSALDNAQPSLGTVGTEGFYLVEETILGVHGLGVPGTWGLLYTEATGGVKRASFGSVGTSPVSQGTGGAPTWEEKVRFVQAAGDPTVNDDVTNYREGAVWQNTTDNGLFMLVDNTDGAAVWTELVPTGTVTGVFATDYPTPASVLAAIVTLSGVAAEAENLGMFTGSTIPDNQTIKAALQTLETALEASSGTSGWPQLSGTASSSAPGSPTAGQVYLADGTNWDPCSLSIGKKYLALFDGAAYVAIIDEDGALYIQAASITPAMLSTTADDDAIEFVIDGGGSAITTGVKGFLEVPYACTINSVTALADQSGSIVVDVWVDSYANYPPTDADSVTASAPVTISSAVKAQDTTLTGWTTALTKGQIIGFNVDSAATVTRVTISLKVDR